MSCSFLMSSVVNLRDPVVLLRGLIMANSFSQKRMSEVFTPKAFATSPML